MNDNEKVRATIVRLAAEQLGLPPEQITDKTEISDPFVLMFDAARELHRCARLADAQPSLTVGDAIKAFTEDSTSPVQQWPCSGPPPDFF